MTCGCVNTLINYREKIAQWMETSLDDATDPWGVKVERVEMYDIYIFILFHTCPNTILLLFQQKRCEATNSVTESNGCWSWGCTRSQSKGEYEWNINVGLMSQFIQVIAAEGEQKASSALRAASEMIAASPGALQLRYLQTLNSISAEKNSTIIFPVPMDLVAYFRK